MSPYGGCPIGSPAFSVILLLMRRFFADIARIPRFEQIYYCGLLIFILAGHIIGNRDESYIYEELMQTKGVPFSWNALNIS
jgi:hypothetical protein